MPIRECTTWRWSRAARCMRHCFVSDERPLACTLRKKVARTRGVQQPRPFLAAEVLRVFRRDTHSIAVVCLPGLLGPKSHVFHTPVLSEAGSATAPPCTCALAAPLHSVARSRVAASRVFVEKKAARLEPLLIQLIRTFLGPEPGGLGCAGGFKTIQRGGGLRAPSLWMVLKPPGAAQTSKTTDFQPNSQPPTAKPPSGNLFFSTGLPRCRQPVLE